MTEPVQQSEDITVYLIQADADGRAGDPPPLPSIPTPTIPAVST